MNVVTSFLSFRTIYLDFFTLGPETSTLRAISFQDSSALSFIRNPHFFAIDLSAICLTSDPTTSSVTLLCQHLFLLFIGALRSFGRMDYPYFQQTNRRYNVGSVTNHNNLYFLNASTSYTANQHHGHGQTVSFNNGTSTFSQSPQPPTVYEDDVQRAIRASLEDEALRLGHSSRQMPLWNSDRRSETGTASITNGRNGLLTSPVSWDVQSEDAPPSLLEPPSSQSLTPPPTYSSLGLQSPNDPPGSPRIVELPLYNEAPPSQPPSQLPSTGRNKPLPASEIAFQPRKPLDFQQFKKDNHLHGSQAVRGFEAELEWWEKRCHVGGCKDKHAHRTIEVQKKGKKWEDGWGGYHRSGPRNVGLRIDSSFCEAHTCRSGGFGRTGKFCKCPKYPWAKYCTCCMEAGRLE